MIFKIKDIAGDGYKFCEELPQEVIGVREDDQLQFVTPLTVDGRIGKADDIVYVNCRIAGRLSGLCAYTLQTVEEDFAQEISFDVAVDKNAQEVDIEEDLRQEIVLSLPMRIVSKGGREKAKEELAKKRAYFNIGEDEQLDRPAVKKENVYRPFEDLTIEGVDE